MRGVRMNHEAYQQFLAGKVRVAPSLGFEVDPATVNPLLKPMTQADRKSTRLNSSHW